jgi:hypothetical protein
MMITDISPEEEGQLPLPKGWIRSISNNNSKTEVAGSFFYKDLGTGNESQEHPFITQALNAARKRDLPDGWVVQNAKFDDGSFDYFYCNSSIGSCNWDPPVLRQCLSEILNANELKQAAMAILPQHLQPPGGASAGKSLSVSEMYQQFKHGTGEVKSSPVGHSPAATMDLLSMSLSKQGRSEPAQVHVEEKGYHHHHVADDDADDDTYNDMRLEELQVEDHSRTSESRKFPTVQFATRQPQDDMRLIGLSKEEEYYQSEYDETSYYYDDDYENIDYNQNDLEDESEVNEVAIPPPSEGVDDKDGLRDGKVASSDQDENNDDDEDSGDDDATKVSATASYSTGGPSMTNSILREQRGRSEKWNLIKQASLAAQDDSMKKQSYRMKLSKPPVSETGLRVLRSDIIVANDRVHELLATLRTKLSLRSGNSCKFLDASNNVHIYKVNRAKSREEAEFADVLVQLAGPVIHMIRMHPEFILATMQNTTPGSLAMPAIAFTVIHRLLHPFSADPGLTTTLLLEAINQQVEETSGM